MEGYKSISVAAGALMLPWAFLSQHTKLVPKPDVNVYINLEGVLRNLTLQRNLNSLVNLHKKKIVLDLEAAIVNLVASYRGFFLKEKYNPKIFLYYTSLNDYPQYMNIYSKYYRNYYRNKYTKNPEYRSMGNLFQEIIIPETKLILSYVKNCYLLESTTFDGSIIPLIVANTNQNPNVLISSDVFDTLYMFQHNFRTIYMKRRYSNLKVISDIDSAVQSIIKGENPFELTIFNSELYYRLLLSIKGSKIRNINSAKGFGYLKFLKALQEGIETDVVLKDFESIESVIKLFPEKYQKDICDAFHCVNLETQYGLIPEADREFILHQIVDNVDNESLEKLNSERFFEFPINLQMLLQ